MKVLLLHPHNPLEGYHYPVPQVALGYLASALKAAGHEVEVLDALLHGWDPDRTVEEIARRVPDVVGFRVWSHQVRAAERVAAGVRAAMPSAKLVIGGPHATTDQEYFGRSPLWDFAIAGEAEEGFPLLLAHLSGSSVDLFRIPGLLRRTDQGVQANPLSQVEDLDRFSVDWECLGLPGYHRKVARTTAYDHGRAKNAFLFMTRGCPYPCTYCAASITNGRRIRSHSAARVFDDIEHLYGRYGVRHFNLMDDNFTFRKETVMEFCDEFDRRRARIPGVTFHNPNGVRVDRLDREMLQRMKRAGWQWLHIGVESGSEATLRRMKKRLDLRKAAENIALIREEGLKCWGFFMLGFVGETREEIEATIQWAVDSRLHAATFSLFSPIPGTEVYRELRASGEIPEDYLMTSYMSPKTKVWAQGLAPEDLLSYQRRALLRFYSRPDRAWHLLRGMSPATVINRMRQIF
ncbi:MAG: radical SAM protein [Bdellovibrionales bacterium]|nr:radical SAM protein [Bdellovibrionales bacterium]